MPVLDHVGNITIEQSDGGNELGALAALGTGLSLLYQTTRQWEFRVKVPEGAEEFASWGGFDGLSAEAPYLLPCFFHWFGTTICNYARLVGFLHGLQAGAFSRRSLEDEKQFPTIRGFCNRYVSSIPELRAIKVWRDKVAAHFAITSPRAGDDNIAMLEDSVFYPISFKNGRFTTGLWSFIRTDSKGKEHRSEWPPWGLTEAFEALAPRYWPSALIMKAPSPSA